MKCPSCGLFTVESTELCECGYDFSTQLGQAESHKGDYVARRPKWIWAITVWYSLSVIWSLLSFAMIYSKAIPLNPDQQGYLARVGIVEYLMTGLNIVILVVGIVQLFRMRKEALLAFKLLLAFNIFSWVVNYLRMGGFVQVIGTPGLVGASIGWLLLAAVLMYVRRLRKQGILT